MSSTSDGRAEILSCIVAKAFSHVMIAPEKGYSMLFMQCIKMRKGLPNMTLMDLRQIQVVIEACHSSVRRAMKASTSNSESLPKF